MKEVKIPVSRVLTIPGQDDVERKTTVTFRHAETTAEMLTLLDGKLDRVLEVFNAGRWTEFRTKVSNALANKTPEQRAIDKMIDSYKTLGIEETQARAMILSIPGMADKLNAALASIPPEIDETFFANKANEANETPDATPEGAPAAA